MDWDKGSKDADATGERICESVGRCACESCSSFVEVEQERIGKVWEEEMGDDLRGGGGALGERAVSSPSQRFPASQKTGRRTRIDSKPGCDWAMANF